MSLKRSLSGSTMPSSQLFVFRCDISLFKAYFLLLTVRAEWCRRRVAFTRSRQRSTPDCSRQSPSASLLPSTTFRNYKSRHATRTRREPGDLPRPAPAPPPPRPSPPARSPLPPGQPRRVARWPRQTEAEGEPRRQQDGGLQSESGRADPAHEPER